MAIKIESRSGISDFKVVSKSKVEKYRRELEREIWQMLIAVLPHLIRQVYSAVSDKRGSSPPRVDQSYAGVIITSFGTKVASRENFGHLSSKYQLCKLDGVNAQIQNGTSPKLFLV